MKYALQVEHNGNVTKRISDVADDPEEASRAAKALQVEMRANGLEGVVVPYRED